MRFRTDLIIEGVPTVDGRQVDVGATEWSGGPWPIRWTDDHDACTVGSIDEIVADDDRVVAVGCLDPDTAPLEVLALYRSGRFRLAADTQGEVDASHTGDVPDLLHIAKIAIMGATVTENPAWPDLRFEPLSEPSDLVAFPAAAQELDDNPIYRFARVIDLAAEYVGVEIDGPDGPVGALGIAALLVLDGLVHLETATKWVSLVQPGDVLDGRVVIHARSEIGTRRNGVTLTVARPVVRESLENADWVDRQTLTFDRYNQTVEVIEGLWPTSW